MGFRFNKRVKICKGVSLNLGKKGASVSVGTKGARVTVGKNGTRTTVGIPGTGISYTDYKKREPKKVDRIEEQVQQLNPLPEGVTIPKHGRTTLILGISTIVSIILSVFSPGFLLIALPLTIINSIHLLTSKKFKVSYYMQKAISLYRTSEIDKSIKYCNKALKINPECKEAMELLNNITG